MAYIFFLIQHGKAHPETQCHWKKDLRVFKSLTYSIKYFLLHCSAPKILQFLYYANKIVLLDIRIQYKSFLMGKMQ